MADFLKWSVKTSVLFLLLYLYRVTLANVRFFSVLVVTWVDRAISFWFFTFSIVCSITQFEYPQMSLNCFLSCLISFSRWWSLEYTLNALETKVSSVPRFHAVGESDWQWRYWYFYSILLFQLRSLYVLPVHLRKVAYHHFLFHMWILCYRGNNLI